MKKPVRNGTKLIRLSQGNAFLAIVSKFIYIKIFDSLCCFHYIMYAFDGAPYACSIFA